MPPTPPRGYLTLTKAAVVDALEVAFKSPTVDAPFRNTKISIEYPISKQSYPSIWVNYEDQDTLTISGIDQREFMLDDPADPESPMREVTRWMFGGEITLTIASLSSLERDNLYDEFVRMFAFSRIERATNGFRDLMESNPFVAIKVNWDELRPHGDGAAPGTPWDTNEVIYEKSVGFDIEGEFVSDPNRNTLALLAEIRVIGTNVDDPNEGGFSLSEPRSDA